MTIHDSSCRRSSLGRCRRPAHDDGPPAEMSTAGDAPSAAAALGGTATRGRVVRCERRRRGARRARAFFGRLFFHSRATRRFFRDANASTRTRANGRARESDAREAKGTSSRSRGRRRCRWRRCERDEIDEMMMTFYFFRPGARDSFERSCERIIFSRRKGS